MSAQNSFSRDQRWALPLLNKRKCTWEGVRNGDWLDALEDEWTRKRVDGHCFGCFRVILLDKRSSMKTKIFFDCILFGTHGWGRYPRIVSLFSRLLSLSGGKETCGRSLSSKETELNVPTGGNVAVKRTTQCLMLVRHADLLRYSSKLANQCHSLILVLRRVTSLVLLTYFFLLFFLLSFYQSIDFIWFKSHNLLSFKVNCQILLCKSKF